MRIAVVALAASLLVGCGGGSELPTKPVEVPTKPAEPLAFDPKDPEITFRWLIQEGSPVRASLIDAQHAKGANPLRDDDKKYRDIHEGNMKRWREFIETLIGKEVVWPVEVTKITRTGVEVDGVPKKIAEQGIGVSARFAEYGGYEGDNFDGKLLLGSSISLEEARTLDPGSKLFVRGKIETINTSIGYSVGSLEIPDYITIRINDTKAVLP